MQSSGAVQSFILQNQLRDYSACDVGWITGVYSFLTILLGIQAGPLMDVYGPKFLGPLATGLLVLMFFMVAECARIWQFILCLGVLGGIGIAIATTVGIAVIGKLFNRRKVLALGIALSGSSTGGIVFPLTLRRTFPLWGWEWSMRAMGFLAVLKMSLSIACLLPFQKLHAMVKPEEASAKKEQKTSCDGLFCLPLVIFLAHLRRHSASRVCHLRRNGNSSNLSGFIGISYIAWIQRASYPQRPFISRAYSSRLGR